MGNIFSQQPSKSQEQTQAASDGFDMRAMSDLFINQNEQTQSPNVLSSQQENNTFSQQQQQPASNPFSQQQQLTSDNMFNHLHQQTVSNMFSQQQLPTSDNMFNQTQQPFSSVFDHQNQPASENMFNHLQQQPASNMFNQPSNNNAFVQQQQSTNDSVFNQMQQQGGNMFSQQEQQPTSNIFYQLQSQPASNPFSLPAQQHTSEMFNQFQPQQTSNMSGHPVQQSNGNIFGVQLQQSGNVFDQQAQQSNGNIFGQMQSQQTSSIFGHPAQQSSGNIFGQVQSQHTGNVSDQQAQRRPGDVFGSSQSLSLPPPERREFRSTPLLQDGQQSVTNKRKRDEDQQIEQHVAPTSMSLDQPPPTEPESPRKVSNPFITSVDVFMEYMDTGEPLEAEDEEMGNGTTQGPTDAEDEQMVSPNRSPERSPERRRVDNTEGPVDAEDEQMLSPNPSPERSPERRRVDNLDQAMSHSDDQVIQQYGGDSTSMGDMAKPSPHWFTTSPAHVTQDNSTQDSHVTQNNTTRNQVIQNNLVQTSPAQNNAANESHTGQQVGNQSFTSSGPADLFTNMKMPSVTSSNPSQSGVTAAPSNQGETTPSPTSTRIPASLSQPSHPSARPHNREFGKLPAIPVDFSDGEKRQFTTAWRLRCIEVGLRKRFSYKRSAADKVNTIKYFELRKRIILAANGGNMPSLAGSKRKAGIEKPIFQEDEPPQKRSKAHDGRHVDDNLATQAAEKGKMAEKRKAGEELSREEHDSGKKPRIADQSETSNIFKGIVGNKDDVNSTKATALNNGVAAPLASDQSVSHTSKPTEFEVPKTGSNESLQCAPNASEPPVFKLPTFNTGSTVNWTTQFAKTAAKSAEQLAKEEKAKRKAEEFDSDDDDEAQWEREYEERLRAKRQKAEAVRAQGTTKLVNGKFVFVSSDDAAKTDSASQTAPETAPQTALQTAPQTAPQSAPQTAPQIAPQTAFERGPNIFGSLPGGQSIFRLEPGGQNTVGSGASGNESGAEDSRTGDADDEGEDGHEGDADGETDDSQEKSQTTQLKLPKSPFVSQSSHAATPLNSQTTTDSAKPSGSGGLFDRVSKDKEGNLIREIPNTPSVLFSTESTAVKKAPFGSLNLDWLSKEKDDAPVKSSKEKEVRKVDHTWGPENAFIKFPIKFSDSPPTVNVTSPSPSKQPFTGIFGAPTTDNTVESPAQPVSVLFSSTPQKAPSSGFNFGFTPSNPTVTSLAPPSNEASAMTSRATTPGITTGESANESTADAQGEGEEEDEAGKNVQIDLTAGGPGEEDEEVIFDVKGKAMIYDPLSANWDVKGVGFLRVLKNRDNGKTRVLMRQDPSGRILLNAALTDRLTYDSTQSKHVRLPVANEKGKIEAWVVRVGRDEDAQGLVRVLEENKSN